MSSQQANPRTRLVPPQLRRASDPPRIRSLAAGEGGPVLEVFAQLSVRSRAQRFLTGVGPLKGAMLRALLALSDGMHHAFVAEVEGRAVGVARWIRLHPSSGTAEVALEVVDAWQGRGIGTALIDRVIESARLAGVDTLLWVHSPDNTAVARLAVRFGGEAQRVDGLVERRTVIGRGSAMCA